MRLDLNLHKEIIMKKLTVGFIGNGKGTNRYHAPFLLTRKDKITIKTIYSRHPSDAWAKIPNVNYVYNIDELLLDPEIDLVIVSTPSASHYAMTKQAILAGKNVVCDKPFCEKLEEAKELFASGKEKGVMVQCYQNRRFDSDFLTTQKVIESGKIGDLIELEMSFDYYRPEVPEKAEHFEVISSFLYGHACHTLDQVISYFGKPDSVHYDVRQLLGEGRMNDYFDIDLYYGIRKVSVKSSYFRAKERPSFVAYGTRGMFVKAAKDRQETHLKLFYMPYDHSDFGVDLPEDYGVLTYYDDNGVYHEEKVISETGDYGRYYDAVYETLINGAPQLVTPEQTLLQLSMLEEGIRNCR